MAQSGQYNYMRCIRHGEGAAAQLAVAEFAKSTINVLFLLNGQYQPYYKWTFRALRALPRLSLLAELLEYLITTDNDSGMYEEKYAVIEDIAKDVMDELKRQEMTAVDCRDLEKHAYSVNDSIRNAAVRNRLCKAGRIGDSIPEDSQQEIIVAEFPQVIVMIITIHQDSMIGDSFVIHQLSIIEG